MDSSDEDSNNVFSADGELMGEVNDESENELQNDVAKDEDKKEGNNKRTKSSTKRVVKNPRVLLNFERLKGPNGIQALNETFKNFQFRGKNHEKEDLTKIIQSLQHWMCHYLYPGFDFETCTAQLEKLGKKRVVQMYMKKLRMEAKENVKNFQQKNCDFNFTETVPSVENYENDTLHKNEDALVLEHDLMTSEIN